MTRGSALTVLALAAALAPPMREPGPRGPRPKSISRDERADRKKKAKAAKASKRRNR